MSAKDLALCFSQKELLIAIHGFAFELGSFLRRKVNVNLIIEDMHSITGFDNFLKFQNALDLMSFALYGSQKTTKGFIEVFEESFTRFNDKIDFAPRLLKLIDHIIFELVLFDQHYNIVFSFEFFNYIQFTFVKFNFIYIDNEYK
jgi:hypothetical protein